MMRPVPVKCSGKSVEKNQLKPIKLQVQSIKKIKKILAFIKNVCYYNKGCGMIALKREVAAHKVRQVFRGANVKLGNWRQVTVPIKETAMIDRQNQCGVL